MSWLDDLVGGWGNALTSEGDNHVWRDTAETVCVRLFSGGVSDAQLVELSNMLNDGDYYNVYIGEADYPQHSYQWNEDAEQDLHEEVAPGAPPTDDLPKMKPTIFGIDQKLVISGVVGLGFLYAKKKRLI